MVRAGAFAAAVKSGMTGVPSPAQPTMKPLNLRRSAKQLLRLARAGGNFGDPLPLGPCALMAQPSMSRRLQFAVYL